MTRDLNVFNLSPAEGDEASSAEWKHVCIMDPNYK